MKERELRNKIKLIKNRLTLAQLYKNEFIEKLGIAGYEEFINNELEELKTYLKLLNKKNDGEN